MILSSNKNCTRAESQDFPTPTTLEMNAYQADMPLVTAGNNQLAN